MGAGLRPGPLGPGTVHVCLDMQRLLAPGGPWPAPWAPRILPAVAALAGRAPGRTIFTRFIPPRDAAAAPGRWRAFYRKWHAVTGEAIDPRQLDLVPDLSGFAPPTVIVDIGCYSAFGAPHLLSTLAALHADTLVFSGTEADVRVLARVFAAVDHGLRAIVARDARCARPPTPVTTRC
ncbi:isochorismatase family protein [Xanthobacter sp. KR7-225]|uniref:isochorismatase family protein n=1 Tax=Xanthobacter sp. KR7-225 TaxID=3156613 RepID=UPI0032B59CCE